MRVPRLLRVTSVTWLGSFRYPRTSRPPGSPVSRTTDIPGRQGHWAVRHQRAETPAALPDVSGRLESAAGFVCPVELVDFPRLRAAWSNSQHVSVDFRRRASSERRTNRAAYRSSNVASRPSRPRPSREGRHSPDRGVEHSSFVGGTLRGASCRKPGNRVFERSPFSGASTAVEGRPPRGRLSDVRVPSSFAPGALGE